MNEKEAEARAKAQAQNLVHILVSALVSNPSMVNAQTNEGDIDRLVNLAIYTYASTERQTRDMLVVQRSNSGNKESEITQSFSEVESDLLTIKQLIEVRDFQKATTCLRAAGSRIAELVKEAQKNGIPETVYKSKVDTLRNNYSSVKDQINTGIAAMQQDQLIQPTIN